MRSTSYEGAVRPLRWWNDSALTEFAHRLNNGWRRWCSEWGFEGSAVQCWNARKADDLYGAVRHWAKVGALPIDGIWLGVPERVPTHWIGRGMFGITPESTMSEVSMHVTRDAWQDLLRELAMSVEVEAMRAIDTPSTTPPAGDLFPWSGSVAARLSLARGPIESLVVHLGPEVARSCAPPSRRSSAQEPQGALISMAQALSHRRVDLEVHLAAAEVELGMLQSLRIGDVVVLSHSLHQPATVCWSTTAEQRDVPALFGGHLGRLGTCKALEAIPHLKCATKTL